MRKTLKRARVALTAVSLGLFLMGVVGWGWAVIRGDNYGSIEMGTVGIDWWIDEYGARSFGGFALNFADGFPREDESTNLGRQMNQLNREMWQIQRRLDNLVFAHHASTRRSGLLGMNCDLRSWKIHRPDINSHSIQLTTPFFIHLPITAILPTWMFVRWLHRSRKVQGFEVITGSNAA